MESNFDLKKFLIENKLTNNSKILENQSSPEEQNFDKEFSSAANNIAAALEKELKNKNPEQLDEAIITATIAGILTANSVVGFVSKYSAKLAKLLNWKKGEDIAEKIHHWAHDNETAFQAPIKRVLSLFVKDKKALDITTKAIYAIVVGGMAAGYGATAVDNLTRAEWFQASLDSLKTLAKGEETILNAYPFIQKLITKA